MFVLKCNNRTLYYIVLPKNSSFNVLAKREHVQVNVCFEQPSCLIVDIKRSCRQPDYTNE